MLSRKRETTKIKEMSHHQATELVENKVCSLVEKMDKGKFDPNNPIHARMMENIRVIAHENSIQEELQHTDNNSH